MIPRSQPHNENDECPICLNVLYRPTMLKNCGHIFCQPCINEATNLYEHKSCPLCRKQFTQEHKVFLAQRHKQMQTLYPELIKSRIANLKQNRYYRLEIGNTTEVVATEANNKYRWTLFVRAAPGQDEMSKFIDKVIVKLHPTFNPSTVTFLGSETVELKRLGWGTFRIDIKIEWTKKYGGFTETYHDLKFDPLVSKIMTCKLGNNGN